MAAVVTADGEGFAEWWRLLMSAEEHSEAIDNAYQQLENANLIGKVVVHRYLCRKRGCVLATVIRVGEVTVARTRDYKLAPNTNLRRTVESARRKNTLDGNHHWPGHTFDVSRLASWGEAASIDMNCRHGLRSVRALDVIAVTEGVTPGHPDKPTLL